MRTKKMHSEHIGRVGGKEGRKEGGMEGRMQAGKEEKMLTTTPIRQYRGKPQVGVWRTFERFAVLPWNHGEAQTS